jgi:hypothetical protein
MKYQIQYWLRTGELIEVLTGVYSSVLVRQSDNPQDLVTFSETLDENYQWSILERMPDGSLTPYVPKQ